MDEGGRFWGDFRLDEEPFCDKKALICLRRSLGTLIWSSRATCSITRSVCLKERPSNTYQVELQTNAESCSFGLSELLNAVNQAA